MQGLHLTADLSGCPPDQPEMTDAAALARCCREAVAAVGLQPVGELFHAFTPAGSGVTGVVLLAESHLAVHTWPELGGVTVDAYVCNHSADNTARAQALLARIERVFAPTTVQRHQVLRGGWPGSAGQGTAA
jgi:S-adenosylmethionine decarboxylase